MICPHCGWDNIAGTDECGQCNSDLRSLDLPRGKSRIEKTILGDDIANLIRREPVTVNPDTSVRDVVRELVEKKRHCAVVVAEDCVVGVFTERDALMKTADCFEEVADLPISRFMTPDPECLRPNDTLNYGLNKMVVGNYRHLPIEENGKPLGVVSVHDVLAFLVDRYGDAIVAPA